MSKAIAEKTNSLSIFWVKKQGYLAGRWYYEGIKWTHGNHIGFTLTMGENEDENIELRYTHVDLETNEEEKMDCKIKLATTPCNYGGKRYWFICPLITKDGEYCGKRIGVIFKIGKRYGCRDCGNIAYAKQMVGGKFRWNGVSAPDLEDAQKEVRRYFYKGKPTRKYKRVIRLDQKIRDSFLAMGIQVDSGR